MGVCAARVGPRRRRGGRGCTFGVARSSASRSQPMVSTGAFRSDRMRTIAASTSSQPVGAAARGSARPTASGPSPASASYARSILGRVAFAVRFVAVPSLPYGRAFRGVAVTGPDVVLSAWVMRRVGRVVSLAVARVSAPICPIKRRDLGNASTSVVPCHDVWLPCCHRHVVGGSDAGVRRHVIFSSRFPERSVSPWQRSSRRLNARGMLS